jgi:hypothetical protein
MFFFPDIFTPYIAGRETAIAANWKDRANYEDIRKKQTENLFGELGLDEYQAGHPGRMAQADAYSRLMQDNAFKMFQGNIEDLLAQQRLNQLRFATQNLMAGMESDYLRSDEGQRAGRRGIAAKVDPTAQPYSPQNTSIPYEEDFLARLTENPYTPYTPYSPDNQGLNYFLPSPTKATPTAPFQEWMQSFVKPVTSVKPGVPISPVVPPHEMRRAGQTGGF